MSVRDGQARLRQLADRMEAGSESIADIQFIVDAFRQIADGEDARVVLNVKAKRGERTSKRYQEQVKQGELYKVLAMGYIAAVMAPEPEGFGLTLEEAVNRPGTEAFGFAEETLLSYWNKHPELRNAVMTLPD